MSIRITFLDVGHGDCTIISQSMSAVVVDVPNKQRLERWLEEHGIGTIDCLYFTHGHKDHFPSLTNFVTFISEWMTKGGTQVMRLCLPTEIIRAPSKAVGSTNITEAQKMLLQSALDKLELWYSTKTLEILRGEKDPRPHSYGDINVHVLHPSFVRFERQNAKQSNTLNETSVVLRVDYGSFRALLLADLEGSGISSLLAHCDENDLKSHVVKVPHHGAWPSNGDELRQLLQVADPEIAVLSVGSTNQHGHVVPELFKALLDLQNDPSYQLEQFVCTEVTRTCVWDAVKRRSNRHEKLEQKMPCAGDISIVAESSGAWVREESAKHTELVNKIGFAACRGKLDF